MIKVLTVGNIYKVFIIALFLVLLAQAGFSDTFAQVPHLEDNAIIDLLSQSPKLSDPERILQDFIDEESTTRVIVSLRKPAIEKHLRNLQDWNVRERLAVEVNNSRENVINHLSIKEVRIINQYDYIFAFSAEVTLQGLQDLINRPDIISIKEDEILQVNMAQGIPLINATDVRTDYDGSGISIAICDTGIDYTHPRLGGGGFPNEKVIGGYDFGDDDPDPMDEEGHGTCCSGIAAGDLGTVGDYIGGIAPSARLYALKVNTNDLVAWESDVVEAWDWCVAHQYDDPANPILIISTSLGYGYHTSWCDDTHPELKDAAANAENAGITIFVSSGNDGYCDGMGYPACISSVVSVGAVYDANIGRSPPEGYVICISADSCVGNPTPAYCSGGKWYVDFTTAADQVPTYSNSADFLDLFAPSNNAYTTDLSGTGGYSSGDYFASFGGTSAACPYAAGAAACLQNAAKVITGEFLTPAEVRARLTDNGDLVTDNKAAVTRPRINLGKAIATLTANQTIPLHTGWNLISFSVNNCYYDTPSPPAVPLLPDVNPIQVPSIGDVFSSIDGKYELVRSFDADGGHTWDPALPLFSNLDYVAGGYGYWIKMTQPADLVLDGLRASTTACLPLHTGWNLVGCWSSDTAWYDDDPPTVPFPPDVTDFVPVSDIGEVFNSIDGSYDIIRSFDADGGHTYDPALPMFSDLHYVGPGYGYWIKMNEEGALCYP